MATDRRVGAAGFLFRVRRARGPALVSVVARIPGAAIGIVLPLLALSEHLSPFVACASFGVCRFAQALAGPVWGRAADRVALRVLLPSAGTGFGLTILLLSVVRSARSHWWRWRPRWVR